MIAASLRPACAAVVAKPARSEWPAKLPVIPAVRAGADYRRDCGCRKVRADVAMSVDAPKDCAIVSGDSEPLAHGTPRTRFRLRAKRDRDELPGSFLIGL